MKFDLKNSAVTDTGKKYKHNEDYYILPESDEKYSITKEKIKQNGNIFILCDGMGGANSGEIASELTAGWIVKDFYSQDTSDLSNNISDKLKNIISGVNSRIFKLASEHDQYKGMCTTIAAAYIKDSFLTISSVGDSRAYLLRNKEISQLSEDHSEVWKLYKTGAITKEELRNHPRNNVLSLAIGAKELIKPDEIFSSSTELKKNDIIMLCSDGLSDMVPEWRIKKILLSRSSLDKKSEKLVKEANQNGGKDNITIILIQAIERKKFGLF